MERSAKTIQQPSGRENLKDVFKSKTHIDTEDNLVFKDPNTGRTLTLYGLLMDKSARPMVTSVVGSSLTKLVIPTFTRDPIQKPNRIFKEFMSPVALPSSISRRVLTTE